MCNYLLGLSTSPYNRPIVLHFHGNSALILLWKWKRKKKIRPMSSSWCRLIHCPIWMTNDNRCFVDVIDTKKKFAMWMDEHCHSVFFSDPSWRFPASFEPIFVNLKGFFKKIFLYNFFFFFFDCFQSILKGILGDYLWILLGLLKIIPGVLRQVCHSLYKQIDTSVTHLWFSMAKKVTSTDDGRNQWLVRR